MGSANVPVCMRRQNLSAELRRFVRTQTRYSGQVGTHAVGRNTVVDGMTDGAEQPAPSDYRFTKAPARNL